jgi:hypothetical protein
MQTPPPPPHDNIRLEMAYEPIESIQLNPHDARNYRPAQRRRLAKAVRKYGPPPFIVTPDRVMISGNIWLEVAREAGYSTAPVIVVDHLTPAEADAYMLFMVRAVELGEWDEKRLGELLLDLSLGELKLELPELTGFDPAEIDLRITGLETASDPAGPDSADEPAPLGPAVTRTGDRWMAGDHALLCGDALKPSSYTALLLGGLAHVCFTDMPFNVNVDGHVSGLGAIHHREFAMAAGEMSAAAFVDFQIQAMRHMAEHSVDGSVHFHAMDWGHAHEMLVAGRRVYERLLNLCVWCKDNGGMGSMYRSQHELFFVWKKGTAPHTNNIQLGQYGRNRTNVWQYPGCNSFSRTTEEGNLLEIHPTCKPVALVADALLDASVRGDIALDPFAGSGTILIAAEKVGRRARAIEIDPLYCDAAVRRWQRWSGGNARLAGDGRTFREIEDDRAGEGRS